MVFENNQLPYRVVDTRELCAGSTQRQKDGMGWSGKVSWRDTRGLGLERKIVSKRGG